MEKIALVFVSVEEKLFGLCNNSDYTDSNYAEFTVHYDISIMISKLDWKNIYYN